MERAEEADLFRRHVLTSTNLEQDITLLYYTGTPSFTANSTKNSFGDPDPHVLGLPYPEPGPVICFKILFCRHFSPLNNIYEKKGKDPYL